MTFRFNSYFVFLVAFCVFAISHFSYAETERTYESYMEQCANSPMMDTPLSQGACGCVYEAQKAADQERELMLARSTLDTLEKQYLVFQERMKGYSSLTEGDLAAICAVNKDYDDRLSAATGDPVQYREILQERHNAINGVIAKNANSAYSNAIQPALNYCMAKEKHQKLKDNVTELETNFVPEFSGLTGTRLRSFVAQCSR